ncbi:hypothetical protein B0H13DRAFT_1915473 [Mycena leptocephala]|nr:hypothetical protein B0H13DRAFT_1915473 [Mycena leptocephala]
MGLIWDGTNYSCAYDAFFVPLACLWRDNPQLWTQRLADCSPLLGLWAIVMSDNREVPEEARDAVRMVLNFQNAADFPLGARGIKLDTLFTAVTDSRRSYGSAVTFCEECGYNLPGVIDTFGHYIDVYNTNVLRRRHPAGPTLSQWFQYHFDCEVNQCPACRSTGRQKKMRQLTTIREVPSLLILCININTLKLDPYLKFGQNDDNANTLKLRGLIYHSEIAGQVGGHFTSVAVDAGGTCGIMMG